MTAVFSGSLCLRVGNKGARKNKLSNCTFMYGIVPVAVEVMFFYTDRLDFGISNLDSFFIASVINSTANKQSFTCRRMADQIDNRYQVIQRMTTPVLTDERKQSMLNIVPLACTRGLYCCNFRGFLSFSCQQRSPVDRRTETFLHDR